MAPMISGDPMTSGARQQQPDGDDECVAAVPESRVGEPTPGDRTALGRAVPIRRRASVDGAPLRAAFLLSHVDNRMTVSDLAVCAQIPLEDAIECFELLMDLGVVELRPGALVAATSGFRPKT